MNAINKLFDETLIMTNGLWRFTNLEINEIQETECVSQNDNSLSEVDLIDAILNTDNKIKEMLPNLFSEEYVNNISKQLTEIGFDGNSIEFFTSILKDLKDNISFFIIINSEESDEFKQMIYDIFGKLNIEIGESKLVENNTLLKIRKALPLTNSETLMAKYNSVWGNKYGYAWR